MEAQASTKPLRKTGLAVLGDQPWGKHFCLFFETKNDLLDILVPFFTTGLANHEFCFWVLADPLTEDEARNALYQALPAADRHLIDRQMEFMTDTTCYYNSGTFSLDRVSSEWGDRLKRALDAGYEGIRVTGCTGWHNTRAWTDFWRYEAALNASISDLPMTVLCTYALDGSSGADILDVTSTHQSAISKRGGKWEVVEAAALATAKEEIRKLNEQLEQRVIERTTELRAAQAELARVERMSIISQLAASITHEIAQPVAAMTTHCSACLRWMESPVPDLNEARASARAALQSGARVNEVFRGIRALVQKAEPQVAQLDMAAVISDTVSLAHGELQHYGVTVTYDFTEQLPSVPGDRVQLQQVMLNLVVNAIQAMAAVSDRPRVLTIGCKPQGDGVLITVEDTGTGFDEAVADRMFTSTFTTKSHGMGFGLAISRWIVAAHGGRIWATSGQGVGAVFHVALPSRRDAGDTGQA